MSDIYVGSLFSEAYLEHHGILGMKWGVRRFQREDGSLTSAGRKRKLVNEHKNEAEKKRGSLKGAGHRALGKVYELNEKAYSKLGNKTLASMNKAAKNQQLKKAERADADAEASRKSRSDAVKAAGHKALGKVYELNEKAYSKLGNKTLASMNKAAKEEQYKKAGYSGETKKSSEKAVKSKEPTKVGEKLKNSMLEGAYNAVDKSDAGRYKRNAETAGASKSIIGRTKDNINAAKGRNTVGGKMSELVGAGAKARKYQNQANYQKALSKSYLSSKNKANAARNARNAEQQAKYFDSVNKGKTKDTLRGRFNIPYEKANGKTTTRGKNYIAGVGKRALKAGAVNIGKKALGAAMVYGAGKMVDYMSTEEFNKKIKG